MTDVVLLHSRAGLRPAVRRAADRLRGAGHTVTTPDLYGGQVFTDLEHRTMFTTADNYVVRIHRQLEDPLLSLVVASALTVDTALKQDSRGLG